MSDNAPYNIPKAPGRWRAITLAMVMHVALFLFFWVGIRWQSETPLTVEAEIWDPQYKEAAPLPTPPQPEPEPVVQQPQPQPQPQPEPKPVAPKVIDEPKLDKPDIALQKEKEKKRKEEQEKQEKADKLKAEKEKAEREKKEQAEKDKADREKKEKLEADKQKKLKEEKQKEEEAKKKADAEKQAADKKKQQQAAADAKAAEQRRQEDLKRMMGQASSTTSATGGTGTAAKSQGPKGTPDYANKLRAKIRSNTVFDNSDVSGNPAGEYTVELFPDGTVRTVRVNKPSGVPGFDEAVRTAIMKSQPFPPDKDGKVPSSFTFTHYPKDQ
nr:cell envelope integrity protein TolA [Herbaspirillum sp. ASV7]